MLLRLLITYLCVMSIFAFSTECKDSFSDLTAKDQQNDTQKHEIPYLKQILPNLSKEFLTKLEQMHEEVIYKQVEYAFSKLKPKNSQEKQVILNQIFSEYTHFIENILNHIRSHLEQGEKQKKIQTNIVQAPDISELTVEYIMQRKNEVRGALDTLEQMIKTADEERIASSLSAMQLKANNPTIAHAEINRILEQDKQHIQHLLDTWSYIKEQLEKAEKHEQAENLKSKDLKLYAIARSEIDQIINTIVFIENYILTKELSTQLMGEKKSYGYDIFKTQSNKTKIKQKIVTYLKQIKTGTNQLKEKISHYVKELKDGD